MEMNRPNLRYLLALLIGAVFICSVIRVVLDTRPGLEVGSFWSHPSEQEADPSVILSRYRNWDSLGVLIFLLLISTGVSLLLPRVVSWRQSDSQPLSVLVFVLLVIGFTLVFQSSALTGGVVLGVFALRLLSTIVVIKLAMKRLNEKYLLLISPLLDIALPLVHIYMVFSNYIESKRARWS